MRWGGLRGRLCRAGLCALAALVLGVPDVVSDEFLNLGLLLVAQLLLADLVRAEHLHQSRHVLNQNVVARYHYLLMIIHICLPLVLGSLRSARHSVRAVPCLLAALRRVARRRHPLGGTCSVLTALTGPQVGWGVAMAALVAHGASLWQSRWSLSAPLPGFDRSVLVITSTLTLQFFILVLELLSV